MAHLLSVVLSVEHFWPNKKPVNHLRLTGFKTGGMDGTRTRDLLRDRQTL